MYCIQLYALSTICSRFYGYRYPCSHCDCLHDITLCREHFRSKQTQNKIESVNICNTGYYDISNRYVANADYVPERLILIVNFATDIFLFLISFLLSINEIF
jgi:hypothetical protein